MADPIDIAVGERIRGRRKALRISQAMLAEAIGVTYQQVQNYERGTNRISASMMARTATALRCTVGDLMGEGVRGALTDQQLEVLAIFDQLSPTQARTILDVAKSMLGDGS